MVGGMQTAASVLTVGSNNIYQVVLDTSEDNWSVSWLVNETQFATYLYSNGNPDIGAVGFGQSGMSNNSIHGEVGEIRLTVQAP